MSVKIQIASLAALERLIGGDTDIEVDIRKSVVENFAKKHLKSIANDTLTKDFQKSIIDTIRQELLLETKVGSGFNTKVVTLLKGELLSQVKNIIATELGSTVRAIADEILNSEERQKGIKNLLNERTDYIAAELSSSVLEKRLDNLVDIKLKNKLGLK